MPNKIKVDIRAEIHDKNGKLVKAYPWKRANSLLRQFIQLLVVQLGMEALTIIDTGGTARSIASHAYNFAVQSPVDTTTYGIVIGTGTTDVAMTDTKLGSQVTANIAHGLGTASVENPDQSTWRAVIPRTLTNNTGSLLSITEVGLYCVATVDLWKICLDRTLYNVSVPSGSAVTLTYRITVSL